MAAGKTSPVALCRVGQPGDGHAVLRLGIVDTVAAGHVTVGRSRRVQAAMQHLRGQVSAQQVARPAQQVERDQRLAADRVHVGQRIGRRDLAEGVGVVDHRGEEVRGGDHGAAGGDLHHGGVVAVLDADQQVCRPALGDQPGDGFLQLAGRDLAGTATPARVLGEAHVRLDGHEPNSSPGWSCEVSARMVPCVLVGTRRGNSAGRRERQPEAGRDE